MEQNEIYSTVGELRKQLGKYVASVGTIWSGGKITTVVWIQKLIEIPKRYNDDHNTRGIEVYGDCVTEVTPRKCKIYGSSFGLDVKLKHYRTNAQDFFRKPTKEEMNIYRDFWRKYRIFGTLPNYGYY